MSRIAAYLPPEGQQAVWCGGPDARIAGTLQPAGTVTPSDGGWYLCGQWLYVSAIEYAQWALLCTHSAATPPHTGGPEMRFLLVPRTAWRVSESWNSVGLRATATHTMIVEQHLVPATHAFTRTDLFAGAPAPRRAMPPGAP